MHIRQSPCCICHFVSISFGIKVLKCIRVDHLVRVYVAVQAQGEEDVIVMEMDPGHPVLVVSEGGQGGPGDPAPDHHGAVQTPAHNHGLAEADARHAQPSLLLAE